jgi:hypothetical protein
VRVDDIGRVLQLLDTVASLLLLLRRLVVMRGLYLKDFILWDDGRDRFCEGCRQNFGESCH